MKQLMKSMEANPMRLLAGACSLVLTLCLSQAGVAQQAAAGVAPASRTFAAVPFSSLAPGASQNLAKPVAEEEEEIAKPQKPGSEGVKVHGHWVLQVKNADGTLGERREFDNSLSNAGSILGGDFVLTGLLSGQITIGGFGVDFITQNGTNPYGTDQSNDCSPNASTNFTCYAFVTVGPTFPTTFGSFKPTNIETGLTIAVTNTNPSSAGVLHPLVLSGNYVVPTGLSTINTVQTVAAICIPESAAASFNFVPATADVSPHACSTSNLGTDTPYILPFTATIITAGGAVTPVTGLTAGQVIQVTVTLSFS